jgi:hypothetical protein
MEPPRTRITVFGGTWPAQIWRLLMLKATAHLPVASFPTPAVEYVQVAVDVTQSPACLPNRFTLPQNIQTLSFIQGTEPTQTCTTPTSLQDVVVPSVIGFPQSEAMATLQQAGFYVLVRVARSTQPVGTVIYQDPAGGTTATQTSTVTITVSKAEPTPSAPPSG